MKYILVLALASVGMFSCEAAKSVLLIEGELSHGTGEHEFVKTVDLLAECLNEPKADVEARTNRVFPDADMLAATDGVFIFSDGMGEHIAKGHLPKLRRFLADGGGLGIVHWALEPVNGDMTAVFDETLGGDFKVNYSINPIWKLEKALLAEHPINRGVVLEDIEDEWYYHIHFEKKVSPVLQAHSPPDSLGKDGPRSGNPDLRAALQNGVPQTLAWTRSTETGARMFGFTGGHYLFNLSDDGYRKLLLNAIVWTADAEVLEDGVQSDITPIPRYPSIDQAIARGNLKGVKRHIGADPEKVQQGSNPRLTPLQQAILCKKKEIALFLIEQGADVNQADGSDRTPLHLAVKRDLPQICEKLLEAEADPDRMDRVGWSPLHHAAAKQRVDAMETLLCADPMCLSERGGTPLHEAAASGSEEIARMLLKTGTDPKHAAKSGVTALNIAREYENTEMIRLLEPVSKG